MTELTDLPVELLQSIISHLHHVHYFSLFELAVSNKQFASLVRNSLLSNIDFIVNGWDEHDCHSKFNEYYKMCQVNPELVHELQHAGFTCAFPVVSARLETLMFKLAQSRTLKELCVDLRIPEHKTTQSLVPSLLLYGPGSFQCLTYLEMDLGTWKAMPAEDVVRLCRMPKLKHFAMMKTWISGCLSEAVLKHPQQHFGKSSINLHTLDVTGLLVHGDLFKLLLPLATNLVRLTSSLPGPGVEIEMGQKAFSRHPTFSPIGLTRILAYVSGTLQELSMTEHHKGDRNFGSIIVHRQSHDGSRLNLSSFSHLRFVTISSYLLFQHYPSAMAAHTEVEQDISNLLPRSIEILTIHFGGNQRVFHNVEGKARCEHNSDPTHSKGTPEVNPADEKIGWLLEILSQKSHKLPHLKNVTIDESRSDALEKPDTIDLAGMYQFLDKYDVDVQIKVLRPGRWRRICVDDLEKFGLQSISIGRCKLEVDAKTGAIVHITGAPCEQFPACSWACITLCDEPRYQRWPRAVLNL